MVICYMVGKFQCIYIVVLELQFDLLLGMHYQISELFELLPPLQKCLAQEEGYLEPLQDDEMILEAYVKSWVSGALDKSVTRQSVAFSLVIHHLSYFIFGNHAGDKNSLRYKLTKSILRDYSRKSEHEGMMIKLIQYTRQQLIKNWIKQKIYHCRVLK